MNYEKALVWFRRDLRDHDHAALAAALRQARSVYCAFVFDTEILAKLADPQDRRVHFIHESLLELERALRQRGGGLIVCHGAAREEIPKLALKLGVGGVFANRDYEPVAKARDAAVASTLRTSDIDFLDFKDQVVFERDEILTQAGHPFTVFTPYKNAWLKRLTSSAIATHSGPEGRLAPPLGHFMPSLASLGFQETDIASLGIAPGMTGAEQRWQEFRENRLARYGELRDYPGVKGVSYLSVHLRFGTISLRRLVAAALEAKADSWLNELIWRDFYFMILDRFPKVVTQSFRPEYDQIVWRDDPEFFTAWKNGVTGYPLVDAAMRQLNYSGWMHNRLRMVVASFLTKDLGIDWRLGEAYFAAKLLDFDLAANNGGWQWAASSGCDAQPYFRIFNPVTQSEKFDPQGRFIRRYVPELAKLPERDLHAPWKLDNSVLASLGIRLGRDYPLPIIDHAAARQETLARYAVVKK